MKPCRTCRHQLDGFCHRTPAPGPYPWESPLDIGLPLWAARFPFTACGLTGRHHQERIGA
ncbi:MAG: hypothetical protein MUE77_12075 [Sandarakinorhabdus sp.]|jgi:hypothetical protein|nr:hypothetical protein [Sandarakinorhabdus sp.]